jgi:hypothetical protein
MARGADAVIPDTVPMPGDHSAWVACGLSQVCFFSFGLAAARGVVGGASSVQHRIIFLFVQEKSSDLFRYFDIGKLCFARKKLLFRLMIVHEEAHGEVESSEPMAALKQIGYTWSYLACRIGQSVPI